MRPWTRRCPSCGTWTSALEPAINERTEREIDEEARARGLRELRERNFEDVLDRVEQLRSVAGTRVLDVGCAYGWFLEAAARRGADALGIEPDHEIAAQAGGRGGNVRVGLFPDVLDDDERFDVIAFNDVLEHIPDVRAALAACAAHLDPGGILSVNIPTSDGLGYRTAVLLARAGIDGPYMRFWQAGLPSPHAHYFPRAGLARVVSEAGFEVSSLEPLAAIVTAGLWERVHMFRRPSPSSVAAFAALRAAAPLLNRPWAADIIHLLAVRS